MINTTSQLDQSGGDINYLIIEYLKSVPFHDNNQKDQLIKKLIENLSFGSIIDMNLMHHESNYDLRGQILRHLNTANLTQIVNQFFTSKPIENDKFYTAEDSEKNGKDSTEKNTSLSYNKSNFWQKNQKCCDFLNFHQKNFNLSYSKTVRDELEYRTILNYSHMKTILGHVQMDENLSISPVPIFCMCFSEDGEFIYTGDNIGTIKIWSTLTGGIIETFRLYSENEEKSAINDLLAFNNCLIACSEDKTVVIWNTKTLQICGSFSFDEGLLNVNGYKYDYLGTNRNLLIIGAESGKMYFIDMDINEAIDEEYKNVFPIQFQIDKSIQDNYNLGKSKSLELSGMSSDDYNGLLVAGFHNGLVCIWDTTRILNAAIINKEYLHNFTQYVFYAQLCHRTTVQLVEFSPDKTHFLTGSLDGTVLVWKIFPELIASIRKDYYLNKQINLFYSIPVSNITTICESEDRIKCSVNVATWTKKNNYIIAMISSKPRKKPKTDNNEIELEEDSNNKKKKSSLIVYSLKLNRIIHKYNEHSGIKGLNFIDGNYIFGCHPLYEEIIFTLNGTRSVILFNIKTGEIIKKFKQNDFFFESDKKTPLSCEGMFSKKGDYFAITTYSGSLSIFSIYTKNSYSATYMNQFYSNEFEQNLHQINNNLSMTGVPSLSSIFPKPVNMYNLPYIIEQPYSCFKLEQIKNNKKLLNTKYGISDREIKNRFLVNNLITYERNFPERVFECQKEEEAYYNAEKDNMNIRINRNYNNDIEQIIPEDIFSQDESYDENESSNDNHNVRNNNRNNSFIDYENEMEIEEEYNDLELSREDLRVTRALRNQNNIDNIDNNSNSNNLWSQRLRRPINNPRSSIAQARTTSTRYNLRNNVRNNSSRSNSRNRNNNSNENTISNNERENNNVNNSIVRNYSLRNRIEINNTNNEAVNFNLNENNNNDLANVSTNEINVYNHSLKKRNHVINDDDDEENNLCKNIEEEKEQEKDKKEKPQDKTKENKSDGEIEEDEDIIIINKLKKDDITEKKEKDKEKEKEKEKEKDKGKEKEKEKEKMKEKEKEKERDKVKEKDKIKEKEKEKVREKEKDKHKRNRKEKEDDEEYKETPIKSSPKNKKKKLRKRGRPKKAKNNDETDEEEKIEESEYQDSESESEDNKEAMKGLEAEELEDSEEKKEPSEDQDNIFIKVDEEDEDKENKNKNIINSIEEVSENKYVFDSDTSALEVKYHKLLTTKALNDNQMHSCFFCKESFMGDQEETTKIYGPFYLNESTGKIISTEPNSNKTLKEIYVDINCLTENNDFKKDDPINSIEEVIKQNKICFRCGSFFATKKCELCQKIFHGNLCLSQMTEDFEGHKYCLECLKTKYTNYLEGNAKPIKKIKYNSVSKNYFLCDKIFNSSYYPQLEEEVYFIMQAYIQFLKDKYEYILYEIEDSQGIFWWTDNSYEKKHPDFNIYEPFVCKVKKIDFCFPSDKTLLLIKERSASNQFNRNIKILIKIQLQIVELDNKEINIILFENDNPDFLVRKNIYKETLKYYKDNISNQKVKKFQVNLSEDVINVTLSEEQPEENNGYFSSSKFNSLKVITKFDKEEQRYSFWDICVNNNDNNIISKKMRFIMEGLLETINSVCEKNEEMNIFYEMVSEDGAPNYYEEVPVPMFIKLIVNRLSNQYYITEESIKFDIQLLVDNAKRYNGPNSGIAKDSEIFKKRIVEEIDKLSKKYEENGNSIILDSDNESNSKKLSGKKRKRVVANLDLTQDMYNLDDNDEDDDYLFGNHKKRELRSSNKMNNINNINGNNNNYNNISTNNSFNNKNLPNVNKKLKKKRKIN